MLWSSAKCLISQLPPPAYSKSPEVCRISPSTVSNELGDAVPIPTLLLELSTLRVDVSTIKLPEIVNGDYVAKLATLVCAAVCSVPVKFPENPVAVNKPVDGL